MNIAYHEATAVGERPSMQDVLLAKVEPSTAYFGVFDGHGEYGGEIAKGAADSFRETLGTIDPSQSFQEKLDRVVACFRSTQNFMKNLVKAETSGTTATLVLIANNYLGVAYVGDSETVFYPDDEEPIKLVKPHSKDNQEEVLRCEKLGYSLKNKYFGGMLAISRAIGDTARPFIVSNPDVKCQLIKCPGTLILASDGIWGSGMNSNHFAIQMAVEKVKQIDKLALGLSVVGANRTKDNASTIVVRLDHN